jgi:hypothetical protein
LQVLTGNRVSTHGVVAPGGHTAPCAIVELNLAGEVWMLRGLGAVVLLKDSRGVRMLAQLLARPGEDLHVLDLSLDSGGAVDGGDAGPGLDRVAIDAYRTRLHELYDEIATAESWNDAGRVARARHEVSLLEAEVKRAVGLGGRERRMGSAAERARVNVRRRIAATLTKVQAMNPALGRHLASAVRTGACCCYRP